MLATTPQLDVLRIGHFSHTETPWNAHVGSMSGRKNWNSCWKPPRVYRAYHPLECHTACWLFFFLRLFIHIYAGTPLVFSNRKQKPNSAFHDVVSGTSWVNRNGVFLCPAQLFSVCCEAIWAAYVACSMDWSWAMSYTIRCHTPNHRLFAPFSLVRCSDVPTWFCNVELLILQWPTKCLNCLRAYCSVHSTVMLCWLLVCRGVWFCKFQEKNDEIRWN